MLSKAVLNDLSENSKTETNFTSIIQQITKKSPFHKILFGKDDDESNQVLKFIKDLDTRGIISSFGYHE
jgi:hypothetical protein